MKKYVLPIIFIWLLTGAAWFKILNQTLIGEGGYYNYIHRFFSGHDGFPLSLFRYDAGARLIYDLVRSVFNDNLLPFQYIMLLGVTLVGVCFYFLVYELTHRRGIAGIAAILFSINFSTVFEMIAIGNFQFFGQRVAQLVPEFFSFLFFVRSMKRKSVTLGVLSLIFLAIALLFAQYGIFFVPFYIIYAIAFVTIEKNDRSRKAFALILTGFSILVSYGVLRLGIVYGGGSYAQGVNIVQFVVESYKQFPIQIVRQLTILTVPDTVIRRVISMVDRSYNDGIVLFYIPVILLYLGSAILLWKRESILRAIIFTSLTFLPVIFVLNLLMRGDEVTKIYTSSRYLHLAGVSFSIFWAIASYSMIKRGLLGSLFVGVLLIWWMLNNIGSIWKEIDKEAYQHIAVKKSLQYVRNLAPTFSTDSIIIVPSELGYYGSYYVQIFYGKEKTAIYPYFSNWANELLRPFDLKKDVILEYDLERETIIDRTEQYREIIAERTAEP